MQPKWEALSTNKEIQDYQIETYLFDGYAANLL